MVRGPVQPKRVRGVGVIAAASRNRRAASANAYAQAGQIVKDCMRGQGCSVLN